MNENEKLFVDAICFLKAGDFQAAEQLFKSILKSEPKHVGALNMLTIVLTAMRRNEEAERFARAAVEVSQNSDVAFYNYGLILKALKRPQDALIQFDKALSINPGDSETWNSR